MRGPNVRATETLVDFLRQKAEMVDRSIDWPARRRKWKKDVAGLYRTVRAWLSPLVAEGTIQIEESKMKLREDYIGAYEIPVLHILIGDQTVIFRPKGALIYGAEGRVDITGARSDKLLLVDHGKWSIVDKSDRVRFIPFTEKSFRGLLEEVMT
jgi:hypothetical protein